MYISALPENDVIPLKVLRILESITNHLLQFQFSLKHTHILAQHKCIYIRRAFMYGTANLTGILKLNMVQLIFDINMRIFGNFYM